MSRRSKVSESPAPNLDDDIYGATPEPEFSQRYAHAGPSNDSPSSSLNSSASDKENSRQDSATSRDRAAMPPPMAPADGDRSSKRKRTVEPERATPNRTARRSRTRGLEDEDEDSLYYDPDQDVEERRRIRKGLRDLTKNVNDNRHEFLGADSRGLYDAVKEANRLSASVKQTADATIDSRLLVTTADLSYKRTVQLTLGESVQGVDVDEFVSKCISFMRKGDKQAQRDEQGLPSGTQRRRARQNDLDDDIEEGGDDGDMMNWAHLGQHACAQYNSRPALAGFLLGPLSTQKRARKVAVRKAGLRPNQYTQTQPSVLTAENIERDEGSQLTVLCTRILRRLEKVQRDGMAAVQAEHDESMSASETQALMDRHGLHQNGGLDMFKFVVNPWSFGQTVENMFYVSFLIRDGKVGIEIGEDGLPSLQPTTPRGRDDVAAKGASKHQAVLEIDMPTWKQLIEVFNIQRPMIPHREEDAAQMGGKGWYG